MSSKVHPRSKKKNFSIEYRHGSLFSAPRGSVLVHAVNTKGVWGKGIAAEFKRRDQAFYEHYRRICRSRRSPLGTADLLAVGDARRACLFTRVKPGYPKDLDAAGIARETSATLAATQRAFEALLAAIKVQERRQGCVFGDICMPMINAGCFCTPWELTAARLEMCGGDAFDGSRTRIVVYTGEQ